MLSTEDSSNPWVCYQLKITTSDVLSTEDIASICVVLSTEDSIVTRVELSTKDIASACVVLST